MPNTLDISVKGCITCDGNLITSDDQLVIKIKDEYVASGFPASIIVDINSVNSATVSGVAGLIINIDYSDLTLPTPLNLCHIDGTPVCYTCCARNSDEIVEIKQTIAGLVDANTTYNFGFTSDGTNITFTATDSDGAVQTFVVGDSNTQDVSNFSGALNTAGDAFNITHTSGGASTTVAIPVGVQEVTTNVLANGDTQILADGVLVGVIPANPVITTNVLADGSIDLLIDGNVVQTFPPDTDTDTITTVTTNTLANGDIQLIVNGAVTQVFPFDNDNGNVTQVVNADGSTTSTHVPSGFFWTTFPADIDTLTKATDSTEPCSLEVSLNGQTPLTGFGQTNDFVEKSVPSNTAGTYITHDIRGENDGVELNQVEAPTAGGETNGETGLPEQRVLVTETKVGCVRKSSITAELRHGNTLYVDKHYNANGTRERADTAFPTIASANTVAVAGDTVVIRSGVYTEQINLKDFVNYQFDAGVTIDVSAGADNNASTTRHAITDGGSTYRGSITGKPNLIGPKDPTAGTPVVVFMSSVSADSDYTMELGNIDGFYGLYLSGMFQVEAGRITYSAVSARDFGTGIATVYNAKGTIKTGDIEGVGISAINFSRRGQVRATDVHVETGNIKHSTLSSSRDAKGAIVLGQESLSTGASTQSYTGDDWHNISLVTGNIEDDTTASGAVAHIGNTNANTRFRLNGGIANYTGAVNTSHTGELLSFSYADGGGTANTSGMVDAHISLQAGYSSTAIVGVVNNAGGTTNTPSPLRAGLTEWLKADIQIADAEYDGEFAFNHFDVNTANGNAVPTKVILHSGSWKAKGGTVGDFTTKINPGAVPTPLLNGVWIVGDLTTNATGNGNYPINSIIGLNFDNNAE